MSLNRPSHVPGRDPLLVLLADSDDDTRLMYGEYLRQSAVEIDEARDGREALVRALGRRHDVVVTETRLPGISGYELCALLRRDASTRKTPIVVVTGEAFPSNLDRARRAGADVVLVKPCLPDVLLTELHRVIARSQAPPERSDRPRARIATPVSRSQELEEVHRRRALSRLFGRYDTTTPPSPPPALTCPVCDKPLTYQRSHVGGVSERHPEQWDYYQCLDGCGVFQYRQRTRKLRQVP
jgi:CheY-like chemotaxis protein